MTKLIVFFAILRMRLGTAIEVVKSQKIRHLWHTLWWRRHVSRTVVYFLGTAKITSTVLPHSAGIPPTASKQLRPSLDYHVHILKKYERVLLIRTTVINCLTQINHVTNLSANDTTKARPTKMKNGHLRRPFSCLMKDRCFQCDETKSLLLTFAMVVEGGGGGGGSVLLLFEVAAFQFFGLICLHVICVFC
jgi:hypothetical protein